MNRRLLSLFALALCCAPAWAGVNVEFRSPSNTNIVLAAPATFTAQTYAYVWEDRERLSAHRLFQNGVQIAAGGLVVDGGSTATATVSGLGSGSYSFTASATNNWGATAYAGITVTVTNAPSVQLGAVTGSPYIAPATLGLSALASDSDGTISKVEFYANGTLISTDTAAPYEFQWANVPAGTYSITARAFDNHGVATTSAASSVTVNPSRVIGYIEGVESDTHGTPHVRGWACSAGRNQSIDIHTYVGGGWPAGVNIDARSANLSSEPAVAAACQAGGAAYRFSVPLSNALRDQHAGKSIHIHGISPVGQPNDLISHSGSYAVPPLTRVATFIAQTAPTTVLAGQNFTASVQVRNDGNAVWRASDGYALGSQNPTNNATWGLARAAFLGDVGPGAIANVHFTANAPTIAGTYNFQWQMVQDGVMWIPSTAPNIPIRVVSGSISASPNPCAFPTGGASCAAGITWSSTASDAEVWLTDANNANAQLFARAQSGTQTANNLTSSISRFHLKAAGVTIATVDVTGVVNPPPTITLTSPAAGAQGTPPATFLLRANASDADGIASVKFYGNGQLLNTDTAAPYEFNWTGVPSGTHSIHAVATDNRGGTASTLVASVVVNAPPTIQLTASAAGNNGIAPASVVLSANAADADDAIASVSFYANGVLLNTDTTAPYAFTWSGVAAGNYDVYAVVRDARGATATTPVVAIAIVVPVVNPTSSTRHYIYDQYQQLCKVVEPETRATVMDYDAAGNLQWSASGLELMGTAPGECNTIAGRDSDRKVTRFYDDRNRLQHLRFPDGRGDQDWVYTATGLPERITTANDGPGQALVVNTYAYKRRGLLTGESSRQPDRDPWGLGYGYDRNGNLASQSYPTGATVTFAPNALGQPTQAVAGFGILASGVYYYPNGAIREFTYGNGIVHSMRQNERQLPRRVISDGVLDYEYGFDPNGNVSHIYDRARGSNTSRWMEYDALDRLTAAGSCHFGGDCWHRFTYDKLDNLTSWKLPGVKDYAEYYYEPGTHRLLSLRNSKGAAVVGFGYDAQGNVSQKNAQEYNFDYGNRLRWATGAESYRYDGHGRRVAAFSPSPARVPILSMYGQSGQILFDEDQRKPGTESQEYVYLAGSVIATRHRNYASGAAEVKYHHTDALGSPVAVTNASGTVIERTDYEPYGAIVGGAQKQGVGYAGHVMDAQTGLTYMQQRYYDSQAGRFLSVDPVSASSINGSNFNRYWYANNNPYAYADPDGRRAVRPGDRGASYVGHSIGGVDVNSAAMMGMANIPTSWLRHEAASGSSSSSIAASVPETVRVEAQDFPSLGEAAKAAGRALGGSGVSKRQELQLGLTQIAPGNWGYLTPGWGPVGATRVDFSSLLAAYRAAGFTVSAWMHGHWDRQGNFSALDFRLVWGSRDSTYLVNRAGQVRVLTDAHLQDAFRRLPFASRKLGLLGLQNHYSESGLPGDEL